MFQVKKLRKAIYDGVTWSMLVMLVMSATFSGRLFMAFCFLVVVIFFYSLLLLPLLLLLLLRLLLLKKPLTGRRSICIQRTICISMICILMIFGTTAAGEYRNECSH